jgi:hypothetical protein
MFFVPRKEHIISSTQVKKKMKRTQVFIKIVASFKYVDARQSQQQLRRNQSITGRSTRRRRRRRRK